MPPGHISISLPRPPAACSTNHPPLPPTHRQVIGYIASHFRKDKIWMRRTRPDKRRYQVVVAVDDSRSMAETGCGAFALEALTLICRAMARLEVRAGVGRVRGRREGCVSGDAGGAAAACWGMLLGDVVAARELAMLVSLPEQAATAIELLYPTLQTWCTTPLLHCRSVSWA